MRSSKRHQLAAAAVFSLIAVVVVGGMAWATESSFRLAKKNVAEEHERRISRAVLEMSSYMAGILNAETWREQIEYRALYERAPLMAFGPGNVEMNAVRVLLPSPLALSGPPKAWIDLYFQVDAQGIMSSPNNPDELSVWFAEHGRTFPTPDYRTRAVWEWLKTALPGINLHERVARACVAEHLGAPSASPDGRASTAQAAMDHSPGCTCAVHAGQGYLERQRRFREGQASYLPPVICIEPDIARRNADPLAEARDDATAHAAGGVQIASDAIVAFWLGQGPDGQQRLAFVREVHMDADTFYQGFVGDWSRLKPELLRQIEEPFPVADLEPVLSDGTDPEAAVDTGQMFNLPVRLAVPDFSEGASITAWRKVRGTVLTMWLAAGAVLAVAGWGLRNLVALTERRMQFAYAVTHELRTPLTTFRLYADMLSAGLVSDESKQEYFDTLNHESLRLSNLVEGVLEYARLENQQVHLNTTDTDGTAILHVVGETLERRCRENGVAAKTENHMTNGRRIRTDVDVVNRIAGVLINNSCRHARGKPHAAVLVRLGGDDGRVFLDVIDTGPGIDRADARAIFKPFRRGRRADQTAMGGIGLGLALARNWAQLLGGRLELAARHDPQYGGANFRLTIPAEVQG